MLSAIEQLGLMRIQIEDGGTHSVEEALQIVSDYLNEMGRAGDGRADRCGALLAGVEISLGEFAASFARAGSPAVSKLSRRLRPKTFNAILKFSDLHRGDAEEPEAEEEE